MRISSYGIGSVATTAIVGTLIILTGALLHSAGGLAIAAMATTYILFTLYFYRDPERWAPVDPNAILAPADGKVLLIRRTDHPLTGEPATLVSIFMSPLDVHVNRIPANGMVSHLQYHPGKFLMAFDHRSMTDNERMEIGLDCPFGTLWFCQVSGFLARRIVCRLEKAQEVTAGNRFGMIKFGSRVDIVVPSTIAITVTEGMRTVAGQTVIGKAGRF